jgi:hypothetical protein
MTTNASPAVGSRRFDSDGEALEHGADAVRNDATAARGHSPDESASCSAGARNMSSKQPTRQEPAGMADVQNTIEALFEGVTVLHDIGLDDRGRSHHYNPDSHQVVVGDDDYRRGGDLAVVERIDIPEGSDGVWDYFAFVREETDIEFVEKDAPTAPPEGDR